MPTWPGCSVRPSPTVSRRPPCRFSGCCADASKRPVGWCWGGTAWAWGVGTGLGNCLGALALALPTGAKSGDASWVYPELVARLRHLLLPGPGLALRAEGARAVGVRGSLPSEPTLWAAKPLSILSAWSGAHPFLSPGLQQPRPLSTAVRQLEPLGWGRGGVGVGAGGRGWRADAFQPVPLLI